MDRHSLIQNFSVSAESESQFPNDLFSVEERLKGAVLIHMFIMFYMFVALAIVCDEFFVPTLGVITERWNISEDVGGATFMAAGGSTPELATACIGLFIAQNNVGTGTILGSATFNILCVLSFCTLFSKTVLQLSWWPLFRDVVFYVISLFLLLLFFADEKVVWWEALVLFLFYIGYCVFMKFNLNAESFVKSRLWGGEESIPDEEQRESMISNRPPLSGTSSVPHNARFGISATPSNPRRTGSLAQRRFSTLSSRRQSIPILHSGAIIRNGIVQQIMSTENGPHRSQTTIRSTSDFSPEPQRSITERRSTKAEIERLVREKTTESKFQKTLMGEEEEHPLDMSWPSAPSRRLAYVFLAPILFPLWVTLPDVRKPESRRFFLLTFLGSILWISFFSYIMVWMANTIGETFGIPSEVLGITILAIGTSVPDLLTSVIVARKGLGDMAVSSSVGSNIFDICVGLPVPWLAYFGYNFVIGRTVDPISISSNGLLCTVSILFVMLIMLVLIVAASGWKMNKLFGILMIVSYGLFCGLSVALELRFFKCPLRLC